jgi:hypothetical protein
MLNNSFSSSVQSAPDAGLNEGKEESNVMRSLICENKSLKAQLAEKDALLLQRCSVFGDKTPASSLALIGTNSTEESADGTTTYYGCCNDRKENFQGKEDYKLYWHVKRMASSCWRLI